MYNESKVNSYALAFPAVFESAQGDLLTDTNGKKYIDFFCGAGALNYGHNHPELKKAVTDFLDSNSIVHCLDMDTVVKKRFLKQFNAVILEPRGLNYKIQFTGPTGTNAVEAAVKLARKITKRRKVVAFTNSFHGMSTMSLALSGCLEDRQKHYPSQDVVFFPYDGFLGENTDTLDYLEKMIGTEQSGLELPAAIILETVQAEGGVNIASSGWLVRLREFTKKNQILLIVDDIQAGCGRTGSFFSFERSGIVPDIVLLSKSISGFGLPLSLLLLLPEYDIWEPGEHNGTFRANNLSLCTATEALNFWKDDTLTKCMEKSGLMIRDRIEKLMEQSEFIVSVRGRGMIWAIEFTSGSIAKKVTAGLFKDGILIETCGLNGRSIKLMPPLNISKENLEEGLDRLTLHVSKLDHVDSLV